MTDEMKLLMAMCDALGFEVDVRQDFEEQIFTIGSFGGAPQPPYIPADRRLSEDGVGSIIPIVAGQEYKTVLIHPNKSYKLTKKPYISPFESKAG